MSPALISRNPDLQRLRDDGYNIAVQAAHVVMRDVPYVTPARVVKRGTLVSPLQLNNDLTMVPTQHVIYFVGEYPCDQNGALLEKIRHGGTQVLAEGLVADHSFSSKPSDGYKDYYDKMTTYASILWGPAHAIDNSVTPKTFPLIPADDEASVFLYHDTASSRAGIAGLNSKLAVPKLAIIGLGGTGSYVLDLVAKTHAHEIHLYDGDPFIQHNAFRSPGAASAQELDRHLTKAEHFAARYALMRRGIIPHPYYVDATNVHELSDMTFVFLSVDKSEPKKPIIAHLESCGVPFIDVGMGINLIDGALQGQLRVTTSTTAQRDHVVQRISLADANDHDEYHQNIQLADLNALNAALAVVRWKKHCGFYHDLDHEHHSTYVIDGNQLVNEDKT
jgi:hypothetical protein